MNAETNQDHPIWIYMTATQKRQAREIVRKLLEAKLIACANFHENWTSMYWWNDQIQEDRETIIIAKSMRSQFSHIEKTVLEHSDYECPCIIALPMVEGHLPYLDWLKNQVKVATSYT